MAAKLKDKRTYGPKYTLIICHLRDPSQFSLVPTFNCRKYFFILKMKNYKNMLQTMCPCMSTKATTQSLQPFVEIRKPSKVIVSTIQK